MPKKKKTTKISKKKSRIDFKSMLQSMTKAKVKEIVDYFNKEFVINGSLDEKLKGYSGLKKEELVEFADTSIEKTYQNKIFNKFEPDFIKKLVNNALLLVAGEHNTEKILSAATIKGGKEYKIYFKGKNWMHKSSIDLENLSSINQSCNCRYGRAGGICLHEMAIYLMLLLQKKITVSDIPMNIDKIWFETIQKRLDLIAAQSLFKEDPAIVLERDYDIYIHDDFLTMEWGGKFPGKQTKNMCEENCDLDDFLCDKVTTIMLRKIKVKKKEGELIRVLIDSYGIIDKIMERPKYVKRILKKLKALENPNYPNNEEELGDFLKRDIKETTAEIALEPPFKAYMGNKHYIFVSYTHKDKGDVFPIIKKLNEEGLNVWYDEGIPLNTDWMNFIMERLENCSIFLSFISPHILDSEMTKKEILSALGEEKQIVCIYLRATELTGGLKLIRNIQGLEKHNMSDDRFFTKLIGEIKNLLK